MKYDSAQPCMQATNIQLLIFSYKLMIMYFIYCVRGPNVAFGIRQNSLYRKDNNNLAVSSYSYIALCETTCTVLYIACMCMQQLNNFICQSSCCTLFAE